MRSNKIQSGYLVPYKNTTTATIFGGSLVKMGRIFGVAVRDIAPGATEAIDCGGVYMLPNSGAVEQGAAYMHGGAFVGTVFAASTATDATVPVILNIGQPEVDTTADAE